MVASLLTSSLPVAFILGAIECAVLIFIGDSVYDIQAGNAAGVTTIGVLWGPFSRADLEAAKPTHIVAQPHELVARWDEELSALVVPRPARLSGSGAAR